MATIILHDGDFGSGIAASFDDEDLFLPNPARPGTRDVVPIVDVAEIESVSRDHSGILKDGIRLGLRGGAALGPVGLAAGVLSVRRASDVNFRVLFKDGRRFLAMADAGTYAMLRSIHVTGRRSAAADPESDPSEAIIAKYLKALDVPAPAAEQPAAAAPAPPAPKPAPGRPAFGRRRGPGTAA